MLSPLVKKLIQESLGWEKSEYKRHLEYISRRQKELENMESHAVSQKAKVEELEAFLKANQ